MIVMSSLLGLLFVTLLLLCTYVVSRMIVVSSRDDSCVEPTRVTKSNPNVI
jgi:hypothetical protein